MLSDKQIAKIEARVEAAIKYCSWGNAAPTLRDDIPSLLTDRRELVNKVLTIKARDAGIERK